MRTPYEQRANGSPQFLGVIIGSATSKNNHDTATPFNDTGHGLAGKLLMVQPDIACYIKLGTVNTVVAVGSATSSSIALVAGERAILRPLSIGQNGADADEAWLAVIAAATVNLKVWELR